MMEPDTIMEVDTVIEVDTVQELTPLDSVRLLLGGTYSGYKVYQRWYRDPAADSTYMVIEDSTYVEFIPQIDACSIDGYDYLLKNAETLVSLPWGTFCFSNEHLADSQSISTHLTSTTYELAWHFPPEHIIAIENQVVVAHPPHFTTRKRWIHIGQRGLKLTDFGL